MRNYGDRQWGRKRWNQIKLLMLPEITDERFAARLDQRPLVFDKRWLEGVADEFAQPIVHRRVAEEHRRPDFLFFFRTQRHVGREAVVVFQNRQHILIAGHHVGPTGLLLKYGMVLPQNGPAFVGVLREVGCCFAHGKYR